MFKQNTMYLIVKNGDKIDIKPTLVDFAIQNGVQTKFNALDTETWQ